MAKKNQSILVQDIPSGPIDRKHTKNAAQGQHDIAVFLTQKGRRNRAADNHDKAEWVNEYQIIVRLRYDRKDEQPKGQ